MTLRASGPEYAPLRVFGDDDLLDAGSDPLLALLGALDGPGEGERVVARLRLRSLGSDWSQGHQQRAHEPALKERTDSYHISESRRHRVELTGAAILAVAGAGLYQGYNWWQAGEEWKTVALGAGVALVLGLAGWAWARWQRARNRVFDPLLIREKVSHTAFEADIEIVAVLPSGGTEERGARPAGAGRGRLPPLRPPGGRGACARVACGPSCPSRTPCTPGAPGLFRGRSVLGVREVASLWHPPGAKDETPLVARSGARVLAPSARSVASGALVGRTTTGAKEIRFPDDVTHRHHLYVARTRMGKSTLMQHPRRPPAAGEGGGARPRRDRRRRPARRPRGEHPRARPRVARRAGAARRPRGEGRLPRRQPARHARLQRPRPHRRLGPCASRAGSGSSGGRACSRSSSRS